MALCDHHHHSLAPSRKAPHPAFCWGFLAISYSGVFVPISGVSQPRLRSSMALGGNLSSFSVPACMLFFGCVTIAQGFVKSYSGLLATRFFLGFGVASVFPGCFYLAAMYVSP